MCTERDNRTHQNRGQEEKAHYLLMLLKGFLEDCLAYMNCRKEKVLQSGFESLGYIKIMCGWVGGVNSVFYQLLLQS